MKVQVLIERGNDGTYGAYISGNNPLSFGAIGEGNSVQEAKDDFMNVVESYRLEGDVPDDVTFEFAYDMQSFLSYYSSVLSLAGLSRLTGINQQQLSHYVTGRRRPSARTVKRMQDAIQSFGKDLSNVHFV